MKKIAIIFSVIIISCLALIGSASASAWLEPFEGPYMTDHLSDIEKGEFNIDETPYFYIKFDAADLVPNAAVNIDSLWHADASSDAYTDSLSFSYGASSGYAAVWGYLDNWDSVKEVGEWGTRLTWDNVGGGTGTACLNFTVVPEPVSGLLFLFGGASLLVLRRRSSK